MRETLISTSRALKMAPKLKTMLKSIIKSKRIIGIIAVSYVSGTLFIPDLKTLKSAQELRHLRITKVNSC